MNACFQPPPAQLIRSRWERDIPKSGDNHVLAMKHLESIRFRECASPYTTMSDVILRQACLNAEMWMHSATVGEYPVLSGPGIRVSLH